LSPQVGGRLKELVGSEQAQALIDYVDSIYLKFGAPHKLYGIGGGTAKLEREAVSAGLTLTPVKLRHLGTELCHETLNKMQSYLAPRLDIRLGTTIKTIAVENGVVKGVETDHGERVSCRYLILGPGREGAEWLCNEAERLKLSLDSNPVDVG